MIVISSSLVLSESDVTLDHPIVGWDNRLTTANIAATASHADYPVTNLANPATHLPWKGTGTGTQYLTHTTGGADPYDFVGIAKHNWGDAEISVSIEGDDGGGYDELVSAVVPGDNAPLLFRFSEVSLAGLRIKLAGASAVPSAAVVFMGKLLVLPRKIWQDHTPIVFGRKQKVISGRSESGNFLGGISTTSWNEGRIKTSLIEPADYREDIDAWMQAAVFGQQTFFFGWRPQTYPNDIGYCWATNDAQPRNSTGHGLTEFDMQIAGIV